jgi:hypothetical protein
MRILSFATLEWPFMEVQKEQKRCFVCKIAAFGATFALGFIFGLMYGVA